MPKALVFYHYFYPDDVVSAVHLTQFCEELHSRNWEVEAMPCNRGCRDDKQTFIKNETWNGIKISRIWRPRFKQSSSIGRILNIVWMIFFWSLAAFRKKPDVLIVGTDPILSLLVAPIWKLIQPNVKIAHWCFDLYPEAAIADGVINKNGLISKILKKMMKSAYSSCDLIVDIGPCMRSLLDKYNHQAKKATLNPWAFVEPSKPLEVDMNERKKIFGDAHIGIIYSGSFGRAHSYKLFLELAEMLKDEKNIHFAFSVGGNCADELIEKIKDFDNISVIPFAPHNKLQQRLSSADIHLVSLRSEWSGTVVPSKFFGVLAVGRQIIFDGSPDSSIARWIEEYNVGWLLKENSVYEISEEIRKIAFSKDLSLSCRELSHRVYQQNFSKKVVMDNFDTELRNILT